MAAGLPLPQDQPMTTSDPDYLQATPFVDSGDPALQAFARKAAGHAQTEKDKAIALYRAVRELDPV